MEAVRVKQPVKMPTMDILLQCRDGLTRKIKKAKKKLEKNRLKDIRDEVDFLIEAL
jgi:hypothetical protein